MTLDRAPQHAKSPDTIEAKLGPGQEDPQRGRRKVRDDDDDNENGDAGQAPGERKRKRSRKGGEKKYLCPQDGCEKSYSRAEHLYRHQLNHTPKQIYYCNFPDCDRHFVRQDLCVRHRDRHTTKGSNLQRKEAYHPPPNTDAGAKTPALVAKKIETNEGVSPAIHTTNYNHTPLLTHSPVESMGPPRQHSVNDNDRYSHAPVSAPPAPYLASAPQRSNRNSQYYNEAPPATQLGRDMTAAYRPPPRHDSFGQLDTTAFLRQNSTTPHAVDGTSADAMQWSTTPRMNAPSPVPNRNASYNAYAPAYPTMGVVPPGYPPPPPPPPPQNGTYSQEFYISNPSNGYMNHRNYPNEEMSIAPHPEAATSWNDTTFPVFDDVYRHSPSTMTDAFASWLLSQNTDSNQPIQRGLGDYIADPALQTSFNNPQSIPTQTSMSVNGLLEAPTLSSVVSMSKCQQIIELIEKTFHAVDNSPLTRQRDQLLSGDWSSDEHVLSRVSMQRYIASYWWHFHDQMPILHRPTFSADKCQNLLLIAVLAIGAANLDKMHGKTVTATAADLASFLVWHLQGKLFEDKDFHPPTKLWVFQTLILLECYEKLYSSRFLHERSTIHHATTISLLRRGSALLGRSVTDPSSTEDNKQSIADTSDPWWNHWITNEATKRVAYALFIIDSTHAVMFGHTSVMLAHEMRLHLPCDEMLWTANSGMAVGKHLQTQQADGIKPITFPDGLKWTLNGKSVRTNRFGRTAIMAGLLNVTWHFVQRDMLRTLATIGGQESVWRTKLTKAFDIWEKDWNNDHEPPTVPPSNKTRHLRESSHSSGSTSNIDEEHTFESRVVLHHLAHMGMHIDIVQCQLYAKAKRLLGRTITPNDYANCAKRMREWALKAIARDAVYYSLKFLEAVLTPDAHHGVTAPQRPPPFRQAGGEYVPRDDYLLNRPWVVYFAALVVWSYGYALDGPLAPSAIPNLETKEDKIADMHLFMNRVGSVGEPGDLLKLVGQRNTCAGLLCFLGEQFKNSRWELMHEASLLMGNCVDMLRGGDGSGGNGVA